MRSNNSQVSSWLVHLVNSWLSRAGEETSIVDFELHSGSSPSFFVIIKHVNSAYQTNGALRNNESRINGSGFNTAMTFLGFVQVGHGSKSSRSEEFTLPAETVELKDGASSETY